MKLKIYVLVDNAPNSTCKSEHGLSYIVEFDKKVLFDTGQSDLFLHNAEIMDVAIDDIETVVLSHGHFDHGDGLHYLEGKKLVCHPDFSLDRFSGKQRKSIGISNVDKLNEHIDITTSKGPYWISDFMVFLGEIPRKFGFEKREHGFYLKNGNSDPVNDDTALAIKMKQGIFIISGCAHSGICNIIEFAKQVTGENKVFGVIGGFHLMIVDKHTFETVDYFKQNEIKIVMPSHCTELPVLGLFNSEFGGEQVKAGNLYTFDEN